LFPLHEEGGPLSEHHRQKLFLNLTRRAVAPLDVEVQKTVGAAKKVDSYFPFAGLVHVKMGWEMVVGIEPQAQSGDLYTLNLAQPVPLTKIRLSTTGHSCNICDRRMAALFEGIIYTCLS
jgi:hypothetical protein